MFNLGSRVQLDICLGIFIFFTWTFQEDNMLKNKKFHLPFRYDVEDQLFIICMSGIEEFPNYITKISDIENKYDSRVISSSFENLNLDSVRQKSNGDLINIEHHSSINDDLMMRDYG